MKMNRSSRVAIAAIGLTCLLTSCGITGGSTGDDEAAMSCMQDLEAGIENAKIVPVGMFQGEEVGTQITDIRKRALLAAEAASANTYWQPLADAWALYEALIQTVVNGGLDPESSESYIRFTKNVNLDYASVSKDTYCRIAFSKKDIPINYESDGK
jgi:hypothetical protein